MSQPNVGTASQSGTLDALKNSFLLKYEFILFVLVLIIIGVLTGTTDGTFWSQANLNNLFVSVAIVGVAAVGATLVIITSGIDISAGSVLGLVATIVAMGGKHGWPLIVIILAALATGCIAGFINGYLIAVAKIPAIIVTLGTLSIWRAAVFMLLGGSWGTDIPPEFSDWLIMKKLAGIPLCFWLVLILVVVSGYMMRNRKWGRYIYALGNNEEATIFSGLPTKRLLIFIYIIAGLLVAVAAILSLGQSPMVQSSTGQGFELNVIAAVVIGGASISGGRGSVMGAFLGAILVELVKNAVILLHIQPFWTGVVMGVMILIAVMVSLSRNKGGAN